MDTDLGIASVNGTNEKDHRIALLNWATTKVDQIAGHNSARDGLNEMLDCVAYFTREHFGFQERVLKECGEQRTYLMDRMAVHYDFRRRLAQIYLDAMRGDITVAERLSSLCHELWLDIQTQQETFTKIISGSEDAPKLRRKQRHEATPFHKALRFDS